MGRDDTQITFVGGDLRSYDDAVVDAGQLMDACADIERSATGLKLVIGFSNIPDRLGELEPRAYDLELIWVVFVQESGQHSHGLSIIGGNRFSPSAVPRSALYAICLHDR